MPSIGFNEIPANILTPGVFAEFDTSRAVQGVFLAPHPVLIVGQMLSTGTADAGTPYRIRSADEAKILFDAHSQVSQMCAAYKLEDTLSELWCIGVANPTGVNATGSFAFTGPATEGGELPLYIGGRRIAVPVENGNTAAEIETAALAALAEADVDLPVSYAGASGTGVDLTALADGTIGNQILLGVALGEGERIPAGVGCTVTPMASGATDPSYSGVITALGDDQYGTLATGAQDSTALGLLVTEFESRWDAMSAIDGQIFACKADTAGNLETLGDSYNTQTLTIVGVEKSALTPMQWEIAAQVAAISAKQAQVAPQKAMVGRKLAGAKAPAKGSRFSRADRQGLLESGISTVKANSAGDLITDALFTTCNENSQGAPDSSLRPLYRVRLLSAYRYSVVARFVSKFTDFSLGMPGDEVPGQDILTPVIARSEFLAHYLDCVDLGWVQKSAFEQYKSELLVLNNLTNTDRLDAITPPNFINAFLVGAFKISFLQ